MNMNFKVNLTELLVLKNLEYFYKIIFTTSLAAG